MRTTLDIFSLPNIMQRIIQWLTIIYIIVLTILLEVPSGVGEVVLTPVGIVRSYVHLFAFILLGFLVELSREKRSILFWVGLLVVYSFATEVAQGLLSPICNRTFAWEDFLQDVLGVLLGTAIGHYCRSFVRQ